MHAIWLPTVTVATQESSWSLSQFLVWFGPPAVLVAVGFVIFFGARAQRSTILEHARQRGALGGETGTPDVGSPDGFSIDEAREQMRLATGRVLAGLIVMLAGVVILLGLTFWRVLS